MLIKKCRTKLSLYVFTLCIAVLLSSALLGQNVPVIPPHEFSRIIRDFSEESGYFRGESWVTNELTYLNVIESIKKNNVSGGVYLGVAPEQNFTYIAAVRPQMAFLIDIRGQNKMQHLLFKMLFEFADTRADFLSLLFSKPLKGDSAPEKSSDINEIIDYLEKTRQETGIFNNTMNKVISNLNGKYKYGLIEEEEENLRYVFKYFFTRNLRMTNGPWRSNYPDLAEIFTDRDHRGLQLNVFNNRDDYLFVRNLHLQNKIIPITGDYAGGKALRKVAEYLKKHKLTVSTHYVSNVEQYVIRSSYNWDKWVANVNNMPYNDKTVFIRWLNWNYYSQDTKLQLFTTFLKDNLENRYYNYRGLLRTEYLK